LPWVASPRSGCCRPIPRSVGCGVELFPTVNAAFRSSWRITRPICCAVRSRKPLRGRTSVSWRTYWAERH